MSNPPPAPAPAPTIAFIGFGEAAQAFTRGWRSRGPVTVLAYDILFDDPAHAEAKRAECRALDVEPVAGAAEAAAKADIVISAVTADQVLTAADSVLPGVHPGLLWLDINSAAPFRKADAAERVAAHGAGTVDVAVMAPVHPRLHQTPLLISGPAAAKAAPILTALGMKVELVSERTGDASTIKMIRSIAIKGFESVTMECVTAAVKLGIEDRIIPSVASSLSNIDFADLADHVMERVVVHGKRRAAEMREVAATLDHAGVSGFLPTATAAHQQWVSDLSLKERFGGEVPSDARRIAREVLAALAERREVQR
jgi:3-hydroxyisobutyrate dehydrogenase-like beta-hydroxyacid dehydrogenase